MTKAPPAGQGGDPSGGVAHLPDAVGNSLIARLAPKSFAPFLQLARIDRPIGWQLLVLPCWQSSALASAHQGAAPRLGDLALFLIGAIAMRGAGSTYNDIVDRDIDAKVERTRLRPIPAGRVSIAAAAAFLAAQCLVGLAALLSFNRFAIALGFASLGFVAIYPFMKRVTSWPQAVLGAAFAWGALMGWAAAEGSLSLAPVLLYCGAIAWTIGYDTIYALQDVKDDAIIGIGSTARFFGEHVGAGVACFYAAAAVFAGAALFAAGVGGLALIGLAGYALHLFWQLAQLRAGGGPRLAGAEALRLFRSNRDAGFILFAGLIAESLRLALAG
ncbi:4-hydroxybenzoate polyprenyl transferase [Methylocella silvestris BL2]|uniref:4-hydroxybenzoate octaprenyltransferase n=1 Tax=Methylocella silvestris (strain DSM 15510 / CIP 108128 / LMG 27833 / NCIMB 13906 / BL2) TaxID=395965 RepID=B8ETH8_METSB|nr:4-hydroxybenzoate octaprenyltransferase [Methylocella silvestris]ACK51820.1 4-hydroxybenzoate polyprenyl transferase [Methylocella silvestris BL2]